MLILIQSILFYSLLGLFISFMVLSIITLIINNIYLRFDIRKKYKIKHDRYSFKITQKMQFIFDKEVILNPDYLNYINYMDVPKDYLSQKDFNTFKDKFHHGIFRTEAEAKEYIQQEIDKLNKSKITEKEVINNLYKENEYLQQRLQELLNK